MSEVVFLDIEADNLNPYSVQAISLIVLGYGSEEYEVYHDSADFERTGSVADGMARVHEKNSQGATFVGHNVLLYDLPAIENVSKKLLLGFSTKVHDTLLISRLMFPKGNIVDTSHTHVTTANISTVKHLLAEKDKADHFHMAEEDEEGSILLSHSLKAWGERLGLYKLDAGKDYMTVTQNLIDYCVRDVEICFKLYEHQIATFGSAPIEFASTVADLYEFDQRISVITHFMGKRGIKIDTTVLYDTLTKIDAELVTLRDEIYKELGSDIVLLQKAPIVSDPNRVKAKIVPFNIGSDVQLGKKLLLKYPEFTPYAYTESGRPSFSEENLVPLIDAYPVLGKVLRLKVLQKRHGAIVGNSTEKYSGSGYVQNLDEAGRIHGTINPHGARTWRATHKLPNIAQTTAADKPYGKEIRAMFTVEEGYSLIGFDISNLEVGTVAETIYRKTGEKALMEQVLHGDKDSGTDTHSLNAAALSNGLKATVSRNLAKTLFFAYLYGASGKKLGSYATDLGCRGSQKDLGEKIKQILGATVKGLGVTRDLIASEFELNGKILLVDGHPVVPRGAHACLNMQGQGLGAVISKYLIRYVVEHLDKAPGVVYNKNTYLIGWIHDEVLVETKPELVDVVKDCVGRACADTKKALDLLLPVGCTIKVGKSWLDTH
jgi:DNA polymerase I-like protein with 3'-5' exonuclease and polymerase domains